MVSAPTRVRAPIAEKYMPVLGYEGIYEVSGTGEVRRIAAGQGARVGHALKPQAHPRGYQTVTLTQSGAQRQFTVHRIVAEAFLGPRPEGMTVNHKNGVKDDNRVANIEWLSNLDNMRHSHAIGLRDHLRKGHTNG